MRREKDKKTYETGKTERKKDEISNRLLISEIKNAYRVPAPTRKEQFLQQIETEHIPGIVETLEISMKEFLLTQVGYIQKITWLMAMFLFGLIVICLNRTGTVAFGILTAIIPMLSLLMVMEGSRSFRYGMEELELSSRFSLKTIVLARLSVLGGMNFILLIIVCPLLWRNNHMHFLYYGVYVLMPYLLTCFLDLLVVRRMRGRESVYTCFAITVLVGSAMLMCVTVQIPLDTLLGNAGWIAVIFLLLTLTAREGLQLLKQTEEYTWNLQ